MEARCPNLIRRLDGPAASPPPELRVTEPVAAWYVADTLRGAPPPENALPNRIAFKTGTSYGYRDALAVGFDRRVTIAVWVGGGPDGNAVPGLVGRAVAAPILFDAFSRFGGEPDSVPMPRDALVTSTAGLPPPLRHIRKDVPKTLSAALGSALKIAYPPDGARIDLGLAEPGPAPSLALKALGGVPPLTLDGQQPARRRERPAPIGMVTGRGGLRQDLGDGRVGCQRQRGGEAGSDRRPGGSWCNLESRAKVLHALDEQRYFATT